MNSPDVLRAVNERWDRALIYTPDERWVANDDGDLEKVLTEEWRPVEAIQAEFQETGHIRDDCDACRIAMLWLPEFGGDLEDVFLFMARLDSGRGHMFVAASDGNDFWVVCDTRRRGETWRLRGAYPDLGQLKYMRPLAGGEWSEVRAL